MGDFMRSELEKLEYLRHVLQEIQNGCIDDYMVQTAMGFAEDLREPYFRAIDYVTGGEE
jgi:hypothetical protein